MEHHFCETRNIMEPAQELGKSIAKILMSEKYDKYTIQECIGIANLALPITTDILLKEEEGEGKNEEGKNEEN